MEKIYPTAIEIAASGGKRCRPLWLYNNWLRAGECCGISERGVDNQPCTIQNMRELDSEDIVLLINAEVWGACRPKNQDQEQRLARLEEEGYVAAVVDDRLERTQPPASAYLLTDLGKEAVKGDQI